MGIKLPWFRARMTVKEGQMKNESLAGTYNYKFDSYFDPNAHSKPIPLDATGEKRNKAKIDALQDKKLPVNNNQSKSSKKTKSKTDSNSEKKISGKEPSLKEHKTNQVLIVREKNITHSNKRVAKKPKKAAAEDSDQHFLTTSEEGVQQNTSNVINKENISMKTDEEKLQPEVGKTSRQFNPSSETRVCNEADSENQKNSQTDDETGILLSPNASNNGTHKSLRERRIPDSNLEQLTIIIPDSSDEDDLISPALDDFHAYDEFDT